MQNFLPITIEGALTYVVGIYIAVTGDILVALLRQDTGLFQTECWQLILGLQFGQCNWEVNGSTDLDYLAPTISSQFSATNVQKPGQDKG